MNTFEFARKLEKITPEAISKIAIEAVHENDGIVVSDSIKANLKGFTFAGNDIQNGEYVKYTDWFHTGQFHDNLQFANENDIDFISGGGGYAAINEDYPEEDFIAPTAKILTPETKMKIQKSTVQKLKALWQTN